jgi:GT2 family glycosyltransferase
MHGKPEPDQAGLKLGVVVVTHNSEKFLPGNVGSLLGQTLLPSHLVLVDSGSDAGGYVEAAGQQARGKIPVVEVILEENLGFCGASNLGYQMLQGAADYVLFLNPDVFLGPETLALLVARLRAGERTGAASCLLLGYDITLGEPTGRIDSAGVFRTWYGRWYDRFQGRRLQDVDPGPCREVPALTGALLLCRRQALQEVLLPGGNVFDPGFFMYKEDIDLCLRLRRRGWRLALDPEARSFHCRGWQDRAAMPKRFRLMSALNEIRVCRKNGDPRILYSLAKYLYVRLFE